MTVEQNVGTNNLTREQLEEKIATILDKETMRYAIFAPTDNYNAAQVQHSDYESPKGSAVIAITHNLDSHETMTIVRGLLTSMIQAVVSGCSQVAPHEMLCITTTLNILNLIDIIDTLLEKVSSGDEKGSKDEPGSQQQDGNQQTQH
jgi:hypothetical protein